MIEVLPRLSTSRWLAIDTEADSLHAYPEKLCLLQISYDGGDRLIDTLANLDLSPFLDILRDREVILHGADYDLRMLWRTFQFRPSKVFDTMIAARLLGAAQFGLTHLVKEHLGVELEKGPQKMDWGQRPLTARMEEYARNDTRYLKPLERMLAARLHEKRRHAWLEQCCEALVEECATPPPIDPEDIWRIKGSDRLKPPALAILREVALWRDREARKQNKPPYFVLSHEYLLQIANRGAYSAAIDEILPRHLAGHRRSEVKEAVQRGRQLPASEYPQPRRSVVYRASQEEKDRFETIKRRRDAHALQLSIDPTLIANKAVMQNLARDWEKGSRSLLPWQRELLDKDPPDEA